MVNVEPYEYQRKTNLKEHNDLVTKINEIVDAINNNNLDTILPKISKLETDVSTIKATDSLQWTDIENLKDSQSAQDVTIGNMDTQVKGVTEALVSGIAIIDGITMGNMKVRVEREKATPIDSNDYNIQKPVSMELIQGSGPSTFKAQITLSDGTIIRSDDFMFTTEAIGTDVYISSFVFKNGNVAGTISADIGLSNGTTIEANNFAVPMDPSLLNTVQDLSTRLSAVEGGQVGGLDELKAQVQTNTTNIGTLTTELDNLDVQKADQSNPTQTIKADTTDLRTVKLRDPTDAIGSYLQFNASADKPVKMEYRNGSEVVDSGFVATVDASGNPKNFTIPSSGEEWEEVDLSNWPTNWVSGDKIKIVTKTMVVVYPGPSSWSASLSSQTININGNQNAYSNEIAIELTNNEKLYGCDLYSRYTSEAISYLRLLSVSEYTKFNSGDDLMILSGLAFNGSGTKQALLYIKPSNIATYIHKMWRLKK